MNMYAAGGNGNSGQTTTGNFGTIDIGSGNNSTDDLIRQIIDGISPDDLSHHGGELSLDPLTDSMTITGDTGLSSGMDDVLQSIVGEPRIIMLYDSVGGNGNTTEYNIVGFAGIRIVEVQLQGNNKHITIQPAIVTDDAVIVNETSGVEFLRQRPTSPGPLNHRQPTFLTLRCVKLAQVALGASPAERTRNREPQNSLSLWESRPTGPERAIRVESVSPIHHRIDPPRPLARPTLPAGG